MLKLARILLFLFILIGLLSIPAPSQAQAGITVTTRYQAQLRGGPGSNFPSLGLVPTDTTLPAVARSADKQWVQVNFNGTIGWIAVRLVAVNGDLNALPVASGNNQPAQPGQPSNPQQPAPTPTKRVVVPQGALYRICVTNQPIDTAPAYDATPGVHPIILLKAAGGVHPFNGSVPRKLVSFDKPQLAACIGDPGVMEIEVCPYIMERTDAEASITRNARTLDVKVIVIQTGQVLGSTQLVGAEPLECRDREAFPIGVTNMVRTGNYVSAQAVVEWVNQFVTR